jgi:hypothetical protein
MKRPIIARMEETAALLVQRWPRRSVKAFYLCEEDHAEFMATNPATGRFPWGNNPTVWLIEPMHCLAPVRLSKAAISRLYSNIGSGRIIQP